MIRYITVTMIGLLAVGCGSANEQEPRTTGAAEGRHEGEQQEHQEIVVLSSEQVAAAGIFTVVAGPGEIRTTLELVASVSPDLDAQAHVNPRVGGLVRTIHGHLGQAVKIGDPLCDIDSVDLGSAVSAFLTADATVQATEEILSRERELLGRNVDLARKVFERERDLAEKEITTLSARYEAERALQDAQLRQDSRILELEGQLARERIERVASARALELLGLSQVDLAGIVAPSDGSSETIGSYVIRAPREGVIVARDITQNEFVDAETTLFEIQDLSRVWVLAAVYEQDLASVRLGSEASVRMDAFPRVAFDGEVDFIDYHIDSGTRAASVRIELENRPIQAWSEPLPMRPGMFGSVEITTGTNAVDLMVPEDALVHEADGDYVFVEHAPGTFERRAVRSGVRTRDAVEILAGLEAGESVAVAGTFTLKSAARSSELGDGD